VSGDLAAFRRDTKIYSGPESEARPLPTSKITISSHVRGSAVVDGDVIGKIEGMVESESGGSGARVQSLRAMSRSWRTAPPYPTWRDYAPWLNAYAEQRLTLPEHQLPVEKSFLDWFQEHQPALRRNSTIWPWNTIITIQLLPLFEADPRAWGAVTSLNRGSTGTNESLAELLAEWRSQWDKQ
jgi:hypothetical protein